MPDIYHKVEGGGGGEGGYKTLGVILLVIKCSKTQVDLRVAGKWFHCLVLASSVRCIIRYRSQKTTVDLLFTINRKSTNGSGFIFH